ncbi:MAG: tetratricopeptide repeat protein [Nitrospirae bacterium]|nr:tetratricopeptide repeat protein [Nitrospirota bacterium]
MKRHPYFLSLTVLVLLNIILLLPGCKGKEDSNYTQSPPSVVTQLNPLDTEKQITTLKEILAKDPNNLTALIKLGNIYMDTNRFQEAIQYYSKVLEIDPQNVDVRVDMGTCFRRMGQPQRAIEEYRKAIKIKPDHLYAHRNSGVVLAFDLNKPKEAIKEFQTYLNLNPNAKDADQIKKIIMELKQRI